MQRKQQRFKFKFNLIQWLKSLFLKDSYVEYKNAVDRILDKIDLFYII